MIETAMFYPLNLIMYTFPQPYAWDILILTRLFCAGLFMFWFMRTMRFTKIPALASAIVFMLSGPLLLLQYWTTNVDIMTPLILLTLERLIHRRSLRELIFLTLAIALSILGGHPEHIFLVNFYAFCFFTFRLWVFRKKIPWKKILFYYASAYLLAGGLTAFVTFPFFRNLLGEFWSGHSPGVGLLLEENPSRFLTLALPHFFQKEAITYTWVFAGWWGGYIGTLPFALAFLALFNNHRNKLNYFFAIAAFLIFSKEYNMPYINWIGYLPLFKECRFASHTPVLAAFSIAALAGMGIRAIALNRNLFYKVLFFSAPLLLIIATHLIILRNANHFALSLKAAGFALGLLTLLQLILFLKTKKILTRKLAGILLTGLVFTELFLYIHRERPYRFNSFGYVPYIENLRNAPERVRSYGNFWAFYPNTASGFEVDDLGYFFGLVPKRFVQLVNTLIVPDHFKNDLRPPALRAIPALRSESILDLLNVKYIIRPASRDYDRQFSHFDNIDSMYKLVYENKVRIYQRPNAYPRAFIVHRALFQEDEKNSLSMLHQLQEKSRYVAILNHPAIPEIPALLKDTPLVDASQTRITHYSANRVIVLADLQHPGLLVLADAYHPDWKVYVDKKERTLLQTDYFIRSVFLPAGRHTVEFNFKPASFFLGMRISFFSLVLIIILGLLPYSRKLKRIC
jgi:uncharacterized membrane protein YfhO